MIKKEQKPMYLLGQEIKPGQSKTINFDVAKLYTSTRIEIPIMVERSKQEGPVVLITAGLHGDEVSGVEIVRQVIAKKINKPERGTIICIPVLNVFGFLSMNRYFPDGKDLNRVFPGTKNGSLASRFAFQFTRDILPIAEYCLDFHTGGASRFNAPQIRVDPNNEEQMKLAMEFNAPFTVVSKNIDKSYRSTCAKLGKQILLYEGGKSVDSNKEVARHGVLGVMRVLHSLGMLKNTRGLCSPIQPTTIITSSQWIRAKYSGLLHNKVECGQYVEQLQIIAIITDPYGKMRHQVKAPHSGHIINVNEYPIVYKGDAIFHISIQSE